VLNACSNATYHIVDKTMCQTLPGRELIEIKVCYGLVPQICDNPEPSKTGAVWRLTRPNPEESGKERHYRLVCGYKKAGSEDVLTQIMDSGLSQKLTECDETLQPLSVSCK